MSLSLPGMGERPNSAQWSYSALIMFEMGWRGQKLCGRGQVKKGESTPACMHCHLPAACGSSSSSVHVVHDGHRVSKLQDGLHAPNISLVRLCMKICGMWHVTCRCSPKIRVR